MLTVALRRPAGYAADAVHKTSMDPTAIADVVLSDKYVLSVRLRTSRNVSGVNLPGATDLAAKSLVEGAVVPVRARPCLCPASAPCLSYRSMC